MLNKKKDFLIKVGQLIKKQRFKRYLSQEELAWKCGISKNALGSIELAKSDMKSSTLATILKVLEINFSELDKL